VLGVGAGCAWSAPDSRSGSDSSAGVASTTPATTHPDPDRTAAVQSSLDAVLTAVRLGDRAAFDSHLASPESTFADRLFANLTTLPTGVQFRAEARTAALPAAQLAALPGGWGQLITVSSRLGHDVGPSTYEVWLAVVEAGDGIRLGGLTDVSGDAAISRPVWLTQRIRLVTGPAATVVAGSRRTDLAAWLRRAESAERAVRERTAKEANPRWANGLVVELPSTASAFDQVLGVTPGSYDKIAAVAWPQGPDPSTAAVRVVVNPDLAGSLDDDRLTVLITHEATHVLPRSGVSPAPVWLVEGFADWVAFDRTPAAAPPTEDLVLTDVRRHGAPQSFPADTDFRPEAADLDLTYGRAWLLCRFIAETWSAAQLVRLYAEVDGGTAVPSALHDVLGVDEQTLLHRWQAWLEHEADR